VRASVSQRTSQKTLDTLLKFSAVINSSLDIEEVLNQSMRWAEEYISAEASTVYELDEEEDMLFIRVARGDKKETVQRIRLQVGEGIAGRVVQTGLPMVVQDVNKEKNFNDRYDKQTGFQTRSMLCVPLTFRDRPIGALQVLNKKSGKRFTESDLALLTAMAQHIAVALENARLYTRLNQEFKLTARELRITQEKLIRSERLAAMGNLVQGIAHEIRNPITTIGGFAARMRRTAKKDSKLHNYADIILEETERLENLVQKVRQLAEVQSAPIQLLDPAPVFRHVVEAFESLASKQGVDLSAHIEESLPLSRIAASPLSTALTNIMENALESMPRGGRLTFRASQENHSIRVQVTDTGCGIAQEDLDSIYDPFFTSKTQGAGLGLTMVHQVVTDHHGEIDIQSQQGKGTTVIIRLPVLR
jgi:signal transduction histidine kinase